MDWPQDREDIVWLGQRTLQLEELVIVLAFEPELVLLPSI